MKGQSLILNIVVTSFALIWMFYTVFIVSDISQDFSRIAESFQALDDVSGAAEQLTYSIFGNSLLLLWFSKIPLVESAIAKTYLLYGTASFLRAVVTLKLLGFRRGIPLLFAFEWMLDFNQARLSIAFSFFMVAYFLSARLGGIIMALSHILPIPLYAFLVFPKKYRLLLLVLGLSGLAVIVPLYFGRYFIVYSSDTIPKYIILYTLLVGVGYFLLRRSRLPSNDVWFFVGLWCLFIYFINLGMTPVYLGRIAELNILFLLSKIGFILKNINIDFNKSVLDFYYFTSCGLIFFYQTLTINGNVWRFFGT